MRPLVLLGLLCCLSCSAAVRGPGAVSGHVGGSLTVTCRYGAKYVTYVKWWCRGAAWEQCRILLQTSGTEQEVRSDRVTIRDDQRRRSFTVTMERLWFSDADTYWCGIERPGTDLGDVVTVTVRPAPASRTAETPTMRLFTFPSGAPTVLNTLGETTGSPSVTCPPAKARPLLSSVHFLLLVFLKVPVLLAMVGAVLYVNWPWRGPRKPTENPQSPSIEGPQKSGSQAEKRRDLAPPPERVRRPPLETAHGKESLWQGGLGGTPRPGFDIGSRLGNPPWQ